ncbi:cysteine desulfuration protein SufE [Plasmodium gaboni]|uniref:Cysteine desulfuration protein SufE n=1 Tax=Plasmodium gaboni TaxID=647221 RepID=A0A151LWC0_9APIC|nr:cysteine desulfuration protein SufE [Plasmodium gaboni]KYO03495.1 cysteine desulfuration protein SufE [Plasmodium gaboni]SOV10339.1 cysteine desulfuration protein SufE [Plasmodium gaboni]SOV20623.1 cysteine desulfuration protein SufE [Plasmodium sp. DRC-Itaito]
MNKKKLKAHFFVLYIICSCFILILSIKHDKYNNESKKKNFFFNISTKIIFYKLKKVNQIKNAPQLYIQFYKPKYYKTTQSLKGIFDEISGNKNPENQKNIDQYNLTPKLKKTVELFQSMPNSPYYKSQQVILMGKKIPSMPDKYKIRQNQVLGCQSVVYIYPKVEENEDKKKVIVWLGHSDGLLTKGIVYILTDGLSGYTPEDILKVNPNFITLTGISEFLTMSRINGYLNIMNKIKIFCTNILKNMDN